MARAKVILVDADVISHFVATGHIFDLNEILAPHHLLIVDNVYREATYHPWDNSRKKDVDNWLAKSNAQSICFPKLNKKVVSEFYRLKHVNKLLGDGEYACMSMAKFGQEVIASSNFRDVAGYCDANGIEYIGVMDILTIAMNKKFWDVAQCNAFIKNAVAANDARFPVYDIRNYIPTRDLSFF